MSIRIFCRQFDVFRMLLVRGYLSIYVDCRVYVYIYTCKYLRLLKQLCGLQAPAPGGTGNGTSLTRTTSIQVNNGYQEKKERLLLLFDEFSNNSSNGSVQYLTVGPEIWIYILVRHIRGF